MQLFLNYTLFFTPFVPRLQRNAIELHATDQQRQRLRRERHLAFQLGSGQEKRPRSRRFANTHAPVPSQYKSFSRVRSRLVKQNTAPRFGSSPKCCCAADHNPSYCLRISTGSLKLAPGDWLLLQANAKSGEHTFTNGERVQVKAIGRDGIALKDGRVLPSAYSTFNYGYAVTSHAAQGKTVDVSLLVASSRSFAAVSRESFYVGIFRARESVTVFTDPPHGTKRKRLPWFVRRLRRAR